MDSTFDEFDANTATARSNAIEQSRTEALGFLVYGQRGAQKLSVTSKLFLFQSGIRTVEREAVSQW